MAHTSYPARLLIKRLVDNYVRPEWKRLALAGICMVLVAGATAANAWMMKPVLDEIFINKNAEMLKIIPIAVLVIAIINGAANYGQTLLMRTTGQRMASVMQLDLFRHLLHSDLSLFHDQASGRLVTRFTHDITLIRNTLTTLLTTTIKQVFTLILLLGVMLSMNWQLTLVAFAAYPLAVFPIFRISRYMRKLAIRSQESTGELSARLDEVFQGARTVKAYGRENYEVSRAKGMMQTLLAIYHKGARTGTAATPLMELLSGVAIASVIWFGGWQVLEGTTTPGAFMAFITALLTAYKPAKSMSGATASFQEGIAASERLFAALDTPARIQDAPDAKPLTLSSGHIRFEEVQFGYTPEIAAVNNLTLNIPAGKTVALVGLSGGGKSTLMNLLLRFYDPDAGRITIDGQDIREVTQASLREHMAYVPQDIMLFDDTVSANIAYGKLGATDADIRHAAALASADSFIEQLPQGYNTPIGPHGLRLSGGQRQRLCIARAMLKNAPILLLDEATSALDNESERAVQQALKELMHGRTTLVIAHRLSTVISADKICVLEQGRIIETGTHKELMKLGGKYASLYAQHWGEE